MRAQDLSYIEGEAKSFWSLSQAVREIEADRAPRCAEIDVLVDELEVTALHTDCAHVRDRVPALLARLLAARTRATGSLRLVSCRPA